MRLFWDYESGKLVKGLTDAQEPDVIWPLRDTVPVEIAIVERDSIAEAYSAIQISQVGLITAENIIIAGKATTDAGDYSFYEDTFVWNSSTTAPRYEGDIDLNQYALISAVGARETLKISAQITLEKDDIHYYSTNFPLWIVNDIISSSIPPSSAANAPQIVNGKLYIYNADQALWFPVTLLGGSGEQSIEIGSEGLDLS